MGEHLTKAGLKGRGWTESLITRFLSSPDATATNPKYRCAAPMKLYDRQRVERAEGTPEFAAAKEKSAARRAGARRAAETKREATLEEAESLPVLPLTPLPKDELIRRAVENYNDYQSGMAMERNGYERSIASADSDESFLGRICVNYLRHECTSYDPVLREFVGRVGTGEAYIVIKRRILGAIAEAYPWLADECADQSERAEQAYWWRLAEGRS